MIEGITPAQRFRIITRQTKSRATIIFHPHPFYYHRTTLVFIPAMLREASKHINSDKSTISLCYSTEKHTSGLLVSSQRAGLVVDSCAVVLPLSRVHLHNCLMLAARDVRYLEKTKWYKRALCYKRLGYIDPSSQIPNNERVRKAAANPDSLPVHRTCWRGAEG